MKKTGIYAVVASLFLSMGLCAQQAESGKPGSFDNAAPQGLQAVLDLDSKLNPGNDEFVVYYVRPDSSYADWALWIWANPGGDGGAAWKYTQDWKESDGIGYMRLKLDGSTTGGIKIASENGGLGMIVRQKSDWIKDCGDDRMWNINTSKKVVIFSGDQNTYAALPYKPSFKGADLTGLNEITLQLSGRYGLDTDGTPSGFVVKVNGKPVKIAKAENPSDSSLNFTKDVKITLSSNVDIGDSVTVGNPAFLGTISVNNAKLAVQMAEKMIPSNDVALGCTYKKGSALFNLWAPTSSSAVLNLYRKANAASPDYSVPMKKNPSNGVWTAEFNKVDPDGMFYDYTLHNSKGKVTVLDPYASSMAAYKGDGAFCRAAVIDFNSPKAGKVDADYVELADKSKAVIYEVSVRDFTISPDANVTQTPGTYKAFIEKIPYLKELGITHVQLLPVLNFYNNNETLKTYEDSGWVNNNNYNWGYDPHNYFTPEGWYATDAEDPYCRVRELRELINECHKAGIGVLLDVVYNHMAGTQFLDDIVPGYYFRTDSKGGLKSNSGCGNDTATERIMMKRLVVDSTSHWVRNYKADGFRFDLMGLMEASSVEDSYKACSKINPYSLFEGEGWKMYNGEPGTVGMDQNYMKKTDDVAVFNDEFRDLLKAGGYNEKGTGFITNRPIDSVRLFRNVTGNPYANYRADKPTDNLNYLVCHDGLTLHDGIVYNCKLDEEKDIKEITSRIKLGNFFEFTSQGLAFLHAGQERGRTKPNINNAANESIGQFVRNSYDSSDNINQIVWTLSPEYQNVLDFTKGLISIRKNYSAFSLGTAEKVEKCVKQVMQKNPHTLCYTIKNEEGTFVIAVNADKKSAKINASVSVDNGVILVDSESAVVTGIEKPKGVKASRKSVVLDPLTATIIHVK